MAAERANDPRAFHDFLGSKLSDREADLTLDEALSLWESENSPDRKREEAPGQWERRLQAWVDAHPSRPINIDDGRESIYAGRGE